MSSALKCPAEAERSLPLGQLRRELGLSQVSLAHRLKVSQPHVARCEHQSDMHISTLQRYIQALGGDLRLFARFPDESHEIMLTPAPPVDHT